MSPPSNPEQTWLRFVHGEALSNSDSEQLAAFLAANPSSARERLEDRRMHGTLRVLRELSTPQESERFVDSVQLRQALESDGARFAIGVDQKLSTLDMQRKQSRKSSSTWVAFSAGFACAAAIALVLWVNASPTRSISDDQTSVGWPPDHMPAFDRTDDLEGDPSARQEGTAETRPARHGVTIERVLGRVSVVKDGISVRARTGMTLADDNGISTDSSGELTLAYADGSVIELGRSTVIGSVASTPPTASGIFNRNVVIEKGWLHATVTPRSESSITTTFLTDAASIRVTGTDLSIVASSTRVRVAVEHGAVEVSRSVDGARVKLGDDQWTDVAIDRPFVPNSVQGEIALVTGRLGRNEGERVGLHALNEAEVALRDRLEDQGWRVKVFSDDSFSVSDAVGKLLVIISSTVESVLIDPGLRDLAVPILSFEVWVFDDLGMTASGETSRHPGQTSVHISPSHSLSAGLSGVVRVSHAPFAMAWGAPALTARVFATTADSDARAAIFGYEQGAAMYGTVAPARRVGFFLADDTAITMTEDGWKLFDAAVRWCVSRAY